MRKTFQSLDKEKIKSRDRVNADQEITWHTDSNIQAVKQNKTSARKQLLKKGI